MNTGIQTGIVFEDKELNCKNEIRLSKEQVSTENRIDYEWYYSDKLEESMEFIEECKNYPNPVDTVAETLYYAKELPSETSSYTANKPGYYLQKANDGYNTQIVIYHVTKPAAATHSFGAWTVKTAATTSAAGVETRTCSVCGNSETREIPKLTGSKADAKITIKNGKKKVSKVSVAKGKSVKLTLELEPKDVKATLVKLDKKSAKIAKVSLKNGKLTIKGKSKGKVTVKIKYGEKTKSFKVTVK